MSKLADPFESLNLKGIEDGLKTRILGRPYGWMNEIWDTVDSTNSRAVELASQGAPEGVMIVARQQTKGRGRQGRAWLSPLDSGIYVSFLLRPQLSSTSLPLVTLGSGVAVHNAVLESTGVNLGLKWVNDLVADGKKVGGILAEMPEGGVDASSRNDLSQPKPLVIGIGLNIQLNPEMIPEPLKPTIQWLECVACAPVDKNLLLCSIAFHLEQMYFQLRAGNSEKVLKQWREFNVTLGKEVKAYLGDSVIHGKAIDINPEGALVIATEDNKRLELHAGEITLRTSDGSYC